jgi:hypothetical protein
MLVYVRKIIPNDDAPEFEFIEAHVIFKDDEHAPHTEAEVTIFLKKDDKMTTQQVIDAAIERAREFLSSVVQFPPSEYHRSQSFLLRSDSTEDTL